MNVRNLPCQFYQTLNVKSIFLQPFALPLKTAMHLVFLTITSNWRLSTRLPVLILSLLTNWGKYGCGTNAW